MGVCNNESENYSFGSEGKRMILKIALLQLLPGKDLNEQLEIGNSSCKKAKEMGGFWHDGGYYAQPLM
jgi:hypothetical protein